MTNELTKVGEVTHFYSNLSVVTVKLQKNLKVGDRIKIKGTTTDFTDHVTEMQYDHQDVVEGKEGQEVGVKVSQKAREGDEVYLTE